MQHQPSIQPDQEFLTPEQVSERYQGRITTRTLQNWRSMGQGPRYTKLGGPVMYRLADLEEWERKQTFAGTGNYRST